MKFVCHQCQRTIFNRRLAHCEFCGADIPEELRLSEDEKKALESQYQQYRRRKGGINQNPDVLEVDFIMDVGWE